MRRLDGKAISRVEIRAISWRRARLQWGNHRRTECEVITGDELVQHAAEKARDRISFFDATQPDGSACSSSFLTPRIGIALVLALSAS
jgi:hypothetical protein